MVIKAAVAPVEDQDRRGDAAITRNDDDNGVTQHNHFSWCVSALPSLAIQVCVCLVRDISCDCRLFFFGM